MYIIKGMLTSSVRKEKQVYKYQNKKLFVQDLTKNLLLKSILHNFDL